MNKQQQRQKTNVDYILELASKVWIQHKIRLVLEDEAGKTSWGQSMENVEYLDREPRSLSG